MALEHRALTIAVVSDPDSGSAFSSTMTRVRVTVEARPGLLRCSVSASKDQPVLHLDRVGWMVPGTSRPAPIEDLEIEGRPQMTSGAMRPPMRWPCRRRPSKSQAPRWTNERTWAANPSTRVDVLHFEVAAARSTPPSTGAVAKLRPPRAEPLRGPITDRSSSPGETELDPVVAGGCATP